MPENAILLERLENYRHDLIMKSHEAIGHIIKGLDILYSLTDEQDTIEEICNILGERFKACENRVCCDCGDCEAQEYQELADEISLILDDMDINTMITVLESII